MSVKLVGEAVLRGSLRLPKTSLPMKANAKEREPRFVEKLTTTLYRRQAERTSDTHGTFALHDGPPFANGGLHMGHFLNKVLKDIINRRQLLLGKLVKFEPGWDCHGLPIELKAIKSTVDASGAVIVKSPLEIRRLASEFARETINVQKDSFQRWGVMADWDLEGRHRKHNAYITMDPSFEAEQLRVFSKMFEMKLVYRSLKPVHWSPSSRTALAEAELEYVDDHKSTAVFVGFPVLSLEGCVGGAAVTSELAKFCSSTGAPDPSRLSVLIWTTTPWTLPMNVALAVHPTMSYVVVEIRSESEPEVPRHFLVCSELVEALRTRFEGYSLSVLAGPFAGAELIGIEAENPVVEGQRSIIIPGLHVTADAGTGIVHTAPCHGHEDFAAVGSWNASIDEAGPRNIRPKLPLISLLDDAGVYSHPSSRNNENNGNKTISECPSAFLGKSIDEGTTVAVEVARNRGLHLHEEIITHRYPYDWRSKGPVIVRATEQWFVDLTPLLPSAALVLSASEKAQGVQFHPSGGRQRLLATISSRTEWCISRQRVWGVPLPAIYREDTGEALMTLDSITKAVEVISERGADVWWDPSSEALDLFLTDEMKRLRDAGVPLRRGSDTLDVWFDSGSSWAAAVPTSSSSASPLGRIADLVLEGSDQHRGWFQSSLLTALAARGEAPYHAVLTHGFVVDSRNRKMSKSLGNVLLPRYFHDGDPEGSSDLSSEASAPQSNQMNTPSSSKKGNNSNTNKKFTSKSGGTKPTAFGVDPLRYWAAGSDYTRDVTISPENVINSSETLRKVRNTLRYMLSALCDFEPFTLQVDTTVSDSLVSVWNGAPADVLRSPSVLPPLEQMALHWLAEFEAEVKRHYAEHNFAGVVSALNTYCSVALSAGYFDTVKDLLYCDINRVPAASADKLTPQDIVRTRRYIAQCVIWEQLRSTLRALAPITPFLAEEVFQHSGAFALPPSLRPAASASENAEFSSLSYFDTSNSARDPFIAGWDLKHKKNAFLALETLRSAVHACTEKAHTAGELGSAAITEIRIFLPVSNDSSHWTQVLHQMDQFNQLHDFLQCSVASLVFVDESAEQSQIRAFLKEANELMTTKNSSNRVETADGSFFYEYYTIVADTPAVIHAMSPGGEKCTRCKNQRPEVVDSPSHICGRCETVVEELGLV